MSSACSFILMQIKVIFIRIVSHLDSLWNRGATQLGNGLLPPLTANSLSSTNVPIVLFSSMAANLARWCHATLKTWLTGAELHQLITLSAHAAWQTAVQIQVTDATVTQMTMYGERTAAFSLKNLTYRCWCWGLETVEALMRVVTTHLENSSVKAMLEWYLTLQCLDASSLVTEVWKHWRCQWERFLRTFNIFKSVILLL